MNLKREFLLAPHYMLPVVILLSSWQSTEAQECPYRPVCAMNGYTYSSICEFNLARLTDFDLQILHEGRCLLRRRTISNDWDPPPFNIRNVEDFEVDDHFASIDD